MASLLDCEPGELDFPFEVNKKLSCSVILRNKTENPVAFKLLSTQRRKYGVQPRVGIIAPGSSCIVSVKMQGLRTAPVPMQCKDKFMILSAVASPDANIEDARNLFNKEASHMVQKFKLNVVFSSPSAEVPSVPTPIYRELPPAITPEGDCQLPGTSNNETNVQNILLAQPSELQFPLKLEKDFSHSFQLSNTTENHVAFMVEASNPSYFIQPSLGIVSPQSICDVTVRMQEESQVPSDMMSENKLMIRSTLASPPIPTGDIDIHDLFEKLGCIVEECEVGIVHTLEKKKGMNIGGAFREGVVFGFLALAAWYLVKHTLSLIWSLIVILMMLMMKMIKKLVSDSLEDWIVKTLLYVLLHLLFKWKEIVQQRLDSLL